MDLPFTISEFFEVFRRYNLGVYPMQFVFYLLGAGLILLVIRKTAVSDTIIPTVLGFFWIWMGVVYHLYYFSTINKAANIFGAFFIIQGLIFLYLGIIRKEFSFKLRADFLGITGALLILYALVIYPILGSMLGHVYPASPSFGVPCPTTIFTFGILLWTERKIRLLVLIIPFLWSIIGFFAAISLDMVEDTGLLVAALAGCTILLNRNMKLSRSI